MTHSKQIIEKRLGISCRHFCCPWGKVKTDYAPDVHPLMARKAGYVSFLTTDHGMNRPGGSVYTIRRISSSAGASSSLMRYSLFPWWKRLTP